MKTLFNLIVNIPLQNQANQKPDMPLIRMSSVIQVKSGHCRPLMQIVGDYIHFRAV